MKEDWQLSDYIVKVQDVKNTEAEVSDDRESWVIELAQMEDNIERTGVINYDEINTPERFLQKANLELLQKLRLEVLSLVSVFNKNKSSSSSSIKVYRINNTDSDFMVFRNSLKLVFSSQRPGVVQISFNVSSASIYSNLSISPNDKIGDVIQAQLGPFNEAIWAFQGVKINVFQMLKFYLTKFIQNSVR